MTSFDRDLSRNSAEHLRNKRLELSTLEVPAGRGWTPLKEKVTETLAAHPARIGEVINLLVTVQSIMDELPPTPAQNRVSAFNQLYLKITQRVRDALPTAQSPEFLELLDVEFAKRYFAALNLWNDDNPDTPDVWEVLFKRADDVAMSRLTAAVLGVNAHINHDLALALIGTWTELGVPKEGDPIHPDYLLVNTIFYEEIPILRRGYSDQWQLDLDNMVGGLDDWSQRILVRVTRAHAWEQGLDLWKLRDTPDDFEQARRTMDRAASLLAEWAIMGDRLINDAGDGWDLLRKLFDNDAEKKQTAA
jgi:hypothetical protein